jgi:large subunit ribosomal protein L15
MELSKLQYTKGSRRHKVKTYGRGYGGVGKRGGKGNKGQRQRKSGKVRLGFEGGQTPIYRKIPKVGFNNYEFKKRYNVITLKELSGLKLDNLNYEILVKYRVIPNNGYPLKIIGNTKIDKQLVVSTHAISSGAKKAIEAAKGSVNIIK